MTLNEALDYIHGLYRRGATPGLTRIRALLHALGDPQDHLKFVHIAGTNGKGSTAAMTASVLTRAGYRTALFTSPYIYRFHERLQIDGEQISDEHVIELVEQVKPLAEVMEDTPTEFEFVTAMAMVYFARRDCDIVVLEVGMGGEKDATNVIKNTEVAVITNIGLDHTDALGDTVEQIAAAKAGILKPGCHCVAYRGSEAVEAVYRSRCAQLSVPLKMADFDSIVARSRDLTGQTFDCAGHCELHIPLLGCHQLHNAAVVLGIIEALAERGWSISGEALRSGLENVSWPGRFDIVGRDPLFIIDGGHNPQCIDALVKNIEDYLTGRKVIALCGVLADKDYGEMFRPVMEKVSRFVCITPDNYRRLPATELAEHLRRAGASAIAAETVAGGVEMAKQLAGNDGVVLCFGSLYSIGDIKAALDAH